MSVCPGKSNASHLGDEELALSGYWSLLTFCSSSLSFPVLPAINSCPNTYPPHEQVCPGKSTNVGMMEVIPSLTKPRSYPVISRTCLLSTRYSSSGESGYSAPIRSKLRHNKIINFCQE